MLQEDSNSGAPSADPVRSARKAEKGREGADQLSFVLSDAPAEDWRKQVPSVSQLTRRLRGHIENSFFDVWVRGEISNLKRHVSGHGYFIVKDASAQLRACMFRPALSKVKFALQDGMEVLVHGKVTIYEARGDYQIVADAIEPVGVGALQLAFEQLKKKLHQEGLFDPRHKKPLPPLPRHIGIITSPTGAAIRDILKVLSRRFPERRVTLMPASVQGDKAAGEICQALGLAQRWNRERPEEAIDVLIVGRGGGSLEDLWPFNEETVARAIFACDIPILSAVGHEIDFTIADFVADVRAPTPSAAAEMAVPKKAELAFQAQTLVRRLGTAVQRRLEQSRLHLGHLGQRLVDPRQRIRLMRQTYLGLREKLQVAIQVRCELARERWKAATQLLHSLSPLGVIARGYTLSSLADGRIMRRTGDVRPGDRITTQVSDGVVRSEVIAVEPAPLPLEAKPS
jgi:exodeoxyribonuclease VII large subunit